MDTKENISYQLIMTNREYLQANGVIEVESFDENMIVAATKLGPLTIKGHNLHIIQLNLEEGKMSIEGVVDNIQYHPNRKSNAGFRGKGLVDRLFK
ncbi:MAG: sporulation protein YabP [Peptococcia bacterium]